MTSRRRRCRALPSSGRTRRTIPNFSTPPAGASTSISPRRKSAARRSFASMTSPAASNSSPAIRQFDDSTIRQFLRVLVDAPCSNTGVFRRRPDARWNWSVEKLESLVKLQAEILDRAAALVAPGGALVYSTCSNEPEENAEQVKAFVARHPEFQLDATRESIPFETGHDGAFAARLVRRPDF